MLGRDPGESHRASTTLELLFDLTFVVAISLCGAQLAHAVAAGHTAVGIGGFAFAMFSILWAWMNYTWFVSAFDTDDWAMRLATLVQMVGVLVLGQGQAPLFASLEHGGADNRVIIAGYVIMRISMVALWLRVAREADH
jgi:low temperature requirement protein LtrA